jgi:hypothetical protein
VSDTAFILIVEDERSHGEAIKEGLERSGHACHLVESGDEAIDSVRARAPHVIITDYRLGAGSRNIAERPARRALPHKINHTLGNVCCIHRPRVTNGRGSSEGDESSTAGEIQHAFALLENRLLHQQVLRRGELLHPELLVELSRFVPSVSLHALLKPRVH